MAVKIRYTTYDKRLAISESTMTIRLIVEQVVTLKLYKQNDNLSYQYSIRKSIF